MAGPAADALRDALRGLANRLDNLIDALSPRDPVRLQLEGAQSDLRDAAGDVDATSIEVVLTNDADLARLRALAVRIDARAASIAASAAKVAGIANVAGAAVTLAGALSGGSIPAILSAVSTLQGTLG